MGFLSIMLANTEHNASPAELFGADSNTDTLVKRMFPKADLSCVLPESRFNRIRKYAANAFSAGDPIDPWDTVRDWMEQFNDHMADLLQLGRYLCLDETMSPFRPRADKFGGLPTLTWIERKPKEFGTEWKTTCTPDGLMTRMELQEGKEPMQKLLLDGYKAKPSTALRMCAGADKGACWNDAES